MFKVNVSRRETVALFPSLPSVRPPWPTVISFNLRSHLLQDAFSVLLVLQTFRALSSSV